MPRWLRRLICWWCGYHVFEMLPTKFRLITSPSGWEAMVGTDHRVFCTRRGHVVEQGQQ